MPRVVDADARRSAIARAALDVARADGLSAVSFRRVAKELGARSTTVVSHYAPSRQDLIALMFNELFATLEAMADSILPQLEPTEALDLLTEAVLPLFPESRLVAALGLEAALELGPAGGFGTELEHWGAWLHDRIASLVTSIGTPAGRDVATDLVIAQLAGLTMYGLIDADNWPPDRQRRSIKALLDLLGLS